MDGLHRTADQRIRQILQGTKETSQVSNERRKGKLSSNNAKVSTSQRPIQTIARRIRQNARGYRSYLIKARSQAGITSLSDFEQLNPYLLDAMCEGYERQQLNQRINLGNLLQQIPLMAQWVSLDQNAMGQVMTSIQDTIEQEFKRIEKEHRDTLVEADSQEMRRADAFAKIFQIKNKQKGG